MLTGAKNISPLIQLLEQIAEQQYEIKTLSHNQVNVHSEISECYGIIINAQAEKRTKFLTYKLQK
jgi:hypothetical protein